ncbi:AraC family transcriptional regulator [Glutamicibacter sp.]|uniref:AraC family transcriptional regulator n=1 Tax=Glutamicibacter sp. TaxID=1931995 RepID=UPI003D6A84E1
MLSQPLASPASTRVLDQLPTLSTSDLHEARERIGMLFCPHELQQGANQSALKMNLRSTGSGIGLHLLDYGAPVKISPEALETFYMVQIPLSGRAVLHLGNQQVVSTARIASVPPIEAAFSMQWEKNTPQIILTAPRDALESAARSLYGALIHGPLRLAPSMDLSNEAGQAFLRSVFELHDMLNAKNGQHSDYARRLQHELVLARWLMANRSNLAQSLEQWSTPTASGFQSRMVKDFLTLLQSHCPEDLTVSEIAEALGVATRTLQVAVARELDSTPSAQLRKARLERARTLLLAADPRSLNVSQIAQECGFTHLGRFAQSYKHQFGVSPSATLRENRK